MSTATPAATSGTGDPGRLVAELTDSAFALAAVAAALRRPDPGAALEPAHAQVLVALGLAEPCGGAWILAPALVGPGGPSSTGLADRLHAALLHAAGLAEGRFTWAEQDAATKKALGLASGPGGRWMVTGLASQLDDLAARLATPGAAALDVGTGVGEIACAMAEAAPALRVVGIDVLDDVLGVARATVTRRRLDGRVTLRRQDVASLSEDAAYDLVYLPVAYIPEPALADALPRIGAALRPGGWVVAAVHVPGPTELGRAVSDWREFGSGGSTWTADETEQRFRLAGFEPVRRVPLGPPLPTIVAAQRPGGRADATAARPTFSAEPP